MTSQTIDWTLPPDPQEIEQLRAAARLSWPEKLQWLEQMHRLIEFMQRSSNAPASEAQPSD